MHGVSLPLESGHGLFLILFATVLIMPQIARLLRLPAMVGLIVGGMIIGPNGLDLIERSGTVAALGGAGLLYLMFQAGLELDADYFATHRRAALVFGALTFGCPFVIGSVVHAGLGFPTLAALLLGSCWASHTLLTYPLFQEARAVSNRAVSIGVAGTIVTDTAALLVLVVLARAHEGDLSLTLLLTQLPLIGLAITSIIVGLPRLTGWYFAGVGRDRSHRFLFVMVALFASSLLAEAVGVEPIIGAFFAGLAMNRHVVERSELAERIDRFGATLFVPLFLVSVGMLVDPLAALRDGRTMLLAAAFTAVVLLGKAIAAAAAARFYGLSGGELLALIGLSVPQAAATLAAVFVGFDIGLLDQATVDAVVVVILATCLVGTAAAVHAIERLPAPPVRAVPIGRRILVPLSDTTTEPGLIELAAAIGRADHGTVLPLAVLDLEARPRDVAARHDELVHTVEYDALAHGCDAQSIVRLDLTRAAGILHAAVEHDATMILVRWDGRHVGHTMIFGEDSEALVALADVPVAVSRAGDLTRYRCVVLRLDEADLIEPLPPRCAAAWAIATRLGRRLRLPVVLSTDASEAALAAAPSISRYVTEVERIPSLDFIKSHRSRLLPDLVVATVSDGSVYDDVAAVLVSAPRTTRRDDPTSAGGASQPVLVLPADHVAEHGAENVGGD